MPSSLSGSIETGDGNRDAEYVFDVGGKQFTQVSTTELDHQSSTPPNEWVVHKEHHSSYPWLIVSPYLEREHQLDLRTVDPPYRLLALALTKLEKACNDYATVKYEDAFEWSSLMMTLKDLAGRESYQWRRQKFYVVEFRSKLKKDIDNELLFKLDKKSHEEATACGGLLKYWYGEPDSERRNLATCESTTQPK